ncbi:MAG TPA: crosslink repair DNA glycosylase YcaQ family protein [Nocardioidaceae bacterium]|nr:crosslink repair DNA glycosylase YcaQ family protein [Nocardioidaceae bacterium]
MTRLAVDRRQAIAYRLTTNHLDRRLPPKTYDEAARFAIQDTIPRSAQVSLHARVDDCESTAWADPRLIQTYSPRAAVHVFPVDDWAVYTVGRLPIDTAEREAIERGAERVCRALAGEERRGNTLPDGADARGCCASGRVAIRWDARLTWVREVPAPEVDVVEARRELCRRHVRANGPTTPETYAWWAGIAVADAHATWESLRAELIEVDLEDHTTWVMAADEAALRSARPPRGVRLLPVEELKLLGADRLGLFAGPTRKAVRAPADRYHPHVLLVDGEPAGAWGRRGGRVSVKLDGPVTPAVREQIEAEALALPIPNATPSVRFV